MSTENFDIEQIRRAWVAMGECIGMHPASDSNPKDLNLKLTALDRLRRKYREFWVVSLIMAFCFYMLFQSAFFIESHLNFRLGVAYAVYFLTCFAMDLWLYNGIGSIDPLRMEVTQVVQKAVYYKKCHLTFMAILIPMAIGLLAFTGYVFFSETYLLSGMIAGAICGAIIGIIQFRRFMADYRSVA